MSYVGPRYEHPVEGHDIRLVLVGMDHGSDAQGPYSEDFASRQRAILSIPKRGSFNPHYQGVVRTAAAIFGSATACATCAEQNQCQRRTEPDRRCVLDMIAQPNLVKCANGSDMRSASTPTMMTNCVGLLLEELEILKPTLLVFHGVGARKPFESVVTSNGWTNTEVHKNLHEIVSAHLRTHVLYLPHPARGHLARQWTTVVEPALSLLRRMGRVPV
jgi:hypothetical protein